MSRQRSRVPSVAQQGSPLPPHAVSRAGSPMPRVTVCGQESPLPPDPIPQQESRPRQYSQRDIA